MSNSDPREGLVYTETIVHSPPAQFAADVPYQLAIIDTDSSRMTVRILGKTDESRVRVGDRVTFVEERDGVAYYAKSVLGTD